MQLPSKLEETNEEGFTKEQIEALKKKSQKYISFLLFKPPFKYLFIDNGTDYYSEDQSKTLLLLLRLYMKWLMCYWEESELIQ